MKKLVFLTACVSVLGFVAMPSGVFGNTCGLTNSSMTLGIGQSAGDNEYVWSTKNAYDSAVKWRKDGSKGSFSFKGTVWECGGSEGCADKYVFKAPSGAYWNGNPAANLNFWCDEGVADSWEKMTECGDYKYTGIRDSSSIKESNVSKGLYYIFDGSAPCTVPKEARTCVLAGLKEKSAGNRFRTQVQGKNCKCFANRVGSDQSGWNWNGSTCVETSAGNGGGSAKKEEKSTIKNPACPDGVDLGGTWTVECSKAGSGISNGKTCGCRCNYDTKTSTCYVTACANDYDLDGQLGTDSAWKGKYSRCVKKSNDSKKGNNGGDAKKGNNSGGAKKSSGNNNNSQYKIPKENCTCKKKNHTCFVEAEGCELQQKGEWVCNKDYDGYDCCYCKGGNKAKKETSNNNKKKKSNNKDSKDDDNNSNNSSTKNQTGDLVAYSCIEHDSDLGAFSVFFGNAEYSRDDTCKNEIIERVTPFLNQVNKTACVYIVGYADSRNSSGNPNLNAKLSRDRTAWVRGLFSSYDAKFRESEAAGDASYTDKISKRYTSEPQQRRVDIIYGQCIENNKAKQNCHEMMAQGKAVRWDDEQQNCVCKQEGYALNAQGECVEILDVAKKREEEALAAARSESRARIISAGRTLDSIKAGFDISVWKNKDGGFNTARLASDGIAGVVLGTAGGLITSNVIKKNQIKGGFEDIKCTIGGQTVADWGDEFQAGISLNGNY